MAVLFAYGIAIVVGLIFAGMTFLPAFVSSARMIDLGGDDRVIDIQPAPQPDPGSDSLTDRRRAIARTYRVEDLL